MVYLEYINRYEQHVKKNMVKQKRAYFYSQSVDSQNAHNMDVVSAGAHAWRHTEARVKGMKGSLPTSGTQLKKKCCLWSPPTRNTPSFVADLPKPLCSSRQALNIDPLQTLLISLQHAKHCSFTLSPTLPVLLSHSFTLFLSLLLYLHWMLVDCKSRVW